MSNTATATRPTAAQFVAAAAEDLAIATFFLLEEAPLALPSVVGKLEHARKARTAGEMVRRVRAALNWSLRRLDATDASELLLATLRAVLDANLTR